MKILKSLLLATALGSALAASGMVPVAFAQAAPAPAAPMAPVAPGPDDGPKAHRGGQMGVSCGVGAATGLQSSLDATATRLALTAEQQPLFDAYRSATLTAQTTFADACATARPVPGGTAPDFLTKLKNRQAIETARLAALTATLPSLEALYNSLTDTQKAQFLPFGGDHRGGPDGGRGGMGRDDRGGRDDKGGGHGRGGRAGRDDRMGDLQPFDVPGATAPVTPAAAG